MSRSKRNELLEKALIAFNRGGYYAVGMDRLVKETGISKTSMYKHFKTKEDLIEAVLRLRDEKFRGWLVGRIDSLAQDPVGRLLAMFDALDEWFHTKEFRSCMFIRASSEYPDSNHQVYKVSAEHKRLILNYVTGLAQQAGVEDPILLAKQLLLLKEGAIVTAHMLGPDGVQHTAKEAAKTLIYASLKKAPTPLAESIPQSAPDA
ncbi:TetR family transcriptional regulator [Kordiimonas sediminis]|uniref:TetR family transcriptional regulator n=1 Tax=Kordiimonas sediminis TaxID=1735581 RepID=A0A919APU6_9PROT|nr:TetR/AcrR family transcriptional regulator [Kordiimonas sediminis]GHF17408.1 TetR family transcriptional regulator [Kordiimonas sediminis]